MTTSNTEPEGRPCPEKDFALREASRRVGLLLCVLAEADDAPDLEKKLAASRLALREMCEVTAVLTRVIAVLERCKDPAS